VSGQISLVVVDTDIMSSVVLPRSVTQRSVVAGDWLELLAGFRIAIAVQTRVELLAWPLVKGWGATRATQLRAAVDAVPTIQVSTEVQEAYAELTAAARRVGHAIHAKEHAADRWIAATAIAVGLPLASGDGVFMDVPGLVRLEAT